MTRIDRDLAFDWRGGAADARLPAGPFHATWKGQLLVRDERAYRLHAWFRGKVRVLVDGKPLLSAERDIAGWSSGESTPLAFGERTLDMNYDAPADGAALKLFWSSDRFPLEPLPAHLLFHVREHVPEHGRINLVEVGRREFDSHRCAACHTSRDRSPSLPAPALAHVEGGLSSDLVIRKLTQRADGERMPRFDVTREEARTIAAYLLSQSLPATWKEIKVDKARADSGRKLFRSVGCLACHQAEGIGSASLLGGGDLSRVGSKRTTGWLDAWLGNPAAIDPRHRMPVFELAANERTDLVAYLAVLVDPHAKKEETPPDGNEADIARGRKLVESLRCVSCHQLTSPASAHRPSIRAPSRPRWDDSCLAARADRSRGRPAFPQVHRDALVAYWESLPETLSPVAVTLRGDRWLERHNCSACHGRGGDSPLGAALLAARQKNSPAIGEPGDLVPPPLTAVGDKLRDDALAEAIRGGPKSPQLPWLRVRMPRFEYGDDERTELLAALIAHDRIPDDPPEVRPAPNDNSADRALLAGHTLIGAKGWSCTACHTVGSFQPANVAIATRGSDLLMLGKRMRHEYFLRWTRAPMRIRPGMEMPSYERPVAGVLNDSVDAQLAALWQALNDPRFTPPTNPTAVEQHLVVRPGEPARVVRDVFRVEGKRASMVPRALAVGLNNGHSLLFDLDRLRLAEWSIGDFASQQTSGKSWFWQLTGLRVGLGAARTELALIDAADNPTNEIIPPLKEFGTARRLLQYSRHNDGVRFDYQVWFLAQGARRTVTVRETISTAQSPDGKTGFRRRLEVIKPADGFDLGFISRVSPQFGSASIAVNSLPAGEHEGRAHIRLTSSSDRAPPAIDIEYLCDPAPTSASLPTVPAKLSPEAVTTVPGFTGVRLPLDRSIMPTAIAWTSQGELAFTSLKGQVYLAKDTDGDGIEDKLTVFEEGLAAPWGLIADGDDLIVAHKPELLRLRDTDGDGRADVRTVVATGWGYSDNYHNWTCGIVRDSRRNLYVGLGSDYANSDRDDRHARWRGAVLKIAPDGAALPIAHSLRYPTGLAIDGRDRLFATDNQGHQNPFNEINHIEPGRHYGVPSRQEPATTAPPTPAAIEIPHPWTRSVNGIAFFPPNFAVSALAGQGIGCEYDARFLVRFSVQQVGETVQGAVYEFSRPPGDSGSGGKLKRTGPSEELVGPLSCAVSPTGDLYIGDIHDSGWGGGRNVGDLVRLRQSGELPNGIREIRTTADGFEVDFFAPVDRALAAQPSSYSISGYTRVWKGGYATEDSGRHRIGVQRAELNAAATSVRLITDALREQYVYDVSVTDICAGDEKKMWPAKGHYTLRKKPTNGPK